VLGKDSKNQIKVKIPGRGLQVHLKVKSVWGIMKTKHVSIRYSLPTQITGNSIKINPVNLA
jgi:hypothetical protein